VSVVGNIPLVLLLAVVEGFLQPACQIVVQVFDSFDAQSVNGVRILFLGFTEVARLVPRDTRLLQVARAAAVSSPPDDPTQSA
jgi:hypothetical protein